MESQLGTTTSPFQASKAKAEVAPLVAASEPLEEPKPRRRLALGALAVALLFSAIVALRWPGSEELPMDVAQGAPRPSATTAWKKRLGRLL